jgi:ribosome-binding protein aMBF1 (putative translation factor)
MLPNRLSPDFPNALIEARVSLGLNRTTFATAANVNTSLIRRYESPQYNDFLSPSEKIWSKLNDCVIRLKSENIKKNKPWLTNDVDDKDLNIIRTRWQPVKPTSINNQMTK